MQIKRSIDFITYEVSVIMKWRYEVSKNIHTKLVYQDTKNDYLATLKVLKLLKQNIAKNGLLEYITNMSFMYYITNSYKLL